MADSKATKMVAKIDPDLELVKARRALSRAVADFTPRNRMKIVTSHPRGVKFDYAIRCVCGFLFMASDKLYRVSCPECGREAFLHSLIRDWGEYETGKGSGPS